MQRSVLQRQLYLDVFWTRAPSAWPFPEAQSPGPVSWHVSLPPPAKEECRCPWGKWKHLVLARPVHISAGPHELAGDACTEENRRPQRWPTSFLLRRPQPRNTDEYVLGSENASVKVTKTDLHPGEIQAVPWSFYSQGSVSRFSLLVCDTLVLVCFGGWSVVLQCLVYKIPVSKFRNLFRGCSFLIILVFAL